VIEPTDIDEILRETKERLERIAKMVPVRAFTSEELTKNQISMYRVILSLHAKCELLKTTVDELKNHDHVDENTILLDDPDTTEATD
jgi:HKD family nuclease